MRVKKAVKQLGKAGSLISAVGSKYTEGGDQFLELLEAASSALIQAQKVLDGNSQETAAEVKPPVEAPVKKQSQSPKSVAQFKGNKTEFIRAVVESHGATGVLPKEIDNAFAAQNVPRSKNLIYNALGALLKQNKLSKKAGRYMAASSVPGTDSQAVKKRISPEGVKRIIEANKKRWAAKKALGKSTARKKTTAK